jgi:hypothetical protein
MALVTQVAFLLNYQTVVRGGQQTVSEERALQRLYQTLNE